jgi:hypothetical protein
MSWEVIDKYPKSKDQEIIKAVNSPSNFETNN